jgi:leader peptidase (prepilin peptidase)/N-methyltransferase
VSFLSAAFGAVAGLLAGFLLRGVVFRLSVPAGAPDRVACPGCDTRLRRWPSLRCPECGHTPGTPAVLELATAAVLALLAGRFGGQPLTLALCFLGALGVALAAIDINVQRLPDRLTLPACAGRARPEGALAGAARRPGAGGRVPVARPGPAGTARRR